MRIIIIVFLICIFGVTLSSFQSEERSESKQIISSSNKCLSCHDGIEEIKDPDSYMMESIAEIAAEAGFAGNSCIVCHGGNPEITDKTLAHIGTIPYFMDNDGPKDFYPDPGSPWINEHTCGYCHEAQTSTQFTSLMFTEAGKIQGTEWGFGGLNGFNHNQGNYDVDELPLHRQLGTEVYLKYMERLKSTEPQVYPGMMKQLPMLLNKWELFILIPIMLMLFWTRKT